MAVSPMRNKNMLYNPYLWPNCRNFCFVKEIGAEEHDGDVRFNSGSGTMAVLCMRNASGHRNSSFIVDLAMEQIPRSSERVSIVDRMFCIFIMHTS